MSRRLRRPFASRRLPSGSRPAKYTSEEEWQQSHRFLLALACASVGRDDPPEMTAEERRPVDDALAFFASLEPTGELSLRQQADLAPYREVIEQVRTDPGGGIVPPGREACRNRFKPETDNY